ncbi:polymeric immunoglobulin receptor-like [Sardina pilchardus]|uniref:polymeric immunoglobulin receptor-like n=1 Tax=Sardina pilchardus TaxID=27697 RepID=UPI002E1685C7
MLRVTGYTGGAVAIKCKYHNDHRQNKKYFCKGTTGLTCSDLIKTGVKNQWVTVERFSLYDHTTGGFFMVTFKDLTLEDTGTYYCAVDEMLSPDKYTKVDLKIMKNECCENALNLSAYVGDTVHISCKFPQEFKKWPKYFCKEAGHQGCKYKLSTPEDQTRVGDEKLSLHDNREGVLTVSISSFSTSDAGSYWCGVDMGDYEALITHVQLTSTKWCCVNTIQMTGLLEGDSVHISCPYPQGYEDTENQ